MAKDLDFTFKAAPAVRKPSREEEALQHLIDAWNSKNVRAGKRVGTFGFMAATLAACGGGGSDSDGAGGDDGLADTSFRFLTGDSNNLVIQGLNVTLDSAKDNLLSVTDLIGSPDSAINASAGLVVPSGQTYIGDISLFDTYSGGISASGDGSLWLLAPATGFDGNGEQIVKLDVDLNGGTLTLDLESDNLTVRIDDQSSVDLNGGTLRISDGDVAVSAATYASWNVGNLIVNSRLVIDLRNTTLTDEDIGKVLTELDAATDAGNTESSLRLLIDDVEQTELVFNSLQANTALNSGTAPKVEVENDAGDISIVDLEALIDSKIAFMAKSLERKIDALELDVTGDTANLDTDVTLKALVDLSNTLAELQDAASGAGGLEERLAAAEGKLAGIATTVVEEITSAVNGLKQQIEGEGFSNAALKSLAELSGAIETLRGDDLTEGSIEFAISEALGDEPTFDDTSGRFVVQDLGDNQTVGNALAELMNMAFDYADDAVAALEGLGEGSWTEGDYQTLSALNTAVRDLEDATSGVGGVSSSLESLQSQITSIIDTNIAGLQGQIDAINGEGDLVANLETLVQLSAAVSDLQDVTSGEGGVTDTLTSLQSQITSILDTNIAGLQGQIDAINGEGGLVANLETLAQLSNAVSALQGASSGEGGLAERIAALEASLGNVTAAPKNWSEFNLDSNTTNAFTVAEIFGVAEENGSSTVLNTFVTGFASRIAGYDSGTVPLSVTGDLTVAQAVALADAGLAVNTANVTYSIRDAYTTVQSALTNPDANSAMAGATEVIAFGNSNPNTIDMMAFGPSINLRVESGSGNDTVSTGSGDQEIYAAFGADTTWLTPTEDDSSNDAVVYQTVYEGETLPVTALTFSDDVGNYSEGSVIKVQVNGETYEYTTVLGDTVATALQAFATEIEASTNVSDVIIKGNVLEILGATPATKLSVVTDSGLPDAIVDISNPGQKTRWKVDFSDNANDYPNNGSLGGTLEFDRKAYITIADQEISANIVYDSTDVANPAATVAALKTAIEAEMEEGGSLANILGSVTVESNGEADVRLVLEGKAAPTVDDGQPTFSVTKAAIDAAGVQQQTTVAFSSDDADYYEGGTLSVVIAGETVTADMVNGDATASVTALISEINNAVSGDPLPASFVRSSGQLTADSVYSGGASTGYAMLGVNGVDWRPDQPASQDVGAVGGVTYGGGTAFFADSTRLGDLIDHFNAQFDGQATMSLSGGSFTIQTVNGGPEVSIGQGLQAKFVFTDNGSATEPVDNLLPVNRIDMSASTEFGSYDAGTVNATLAAALESVELSEAVVSEAKDVRVVDNLQVTPQTVSYQLDVDGAFYVLDSEVVWGEGSRDPRYGIDSSLPRIDGFIDQNGTITPTTRIDLHYVRFDSVDDFISSLKLEKLPTGAPITDAYDASYNAGTLTFTQKDGGIEFGLRTFELTIGKADPITGLTLTAATEASDPLSATAEQTYEGEAQQATISLEDASTYGPGERPIDVYYEGGKAYVKITGYGVDGVLGSSDDDIHIVSVDPVTDTYVLSYSAVDGVALTAEMTADSGMWDNAGQEEPQEKYSMFDWRAPNSGQAQIQLDSTSTVGSFVENLKGFGLNEATYITDAKLVDGSIQITVDRAGSKADEGSAKILHWYVPLSFGGHVLQLDGYGSTYFNPAFLNASTLIVQPPSIAVATSQALAEEILSEVGDIIDSASVNGKTGKMTLTGASPGESTFEVSDVRLDYQGAKQIATIDVTGLDDADGTPILYTENGTFSVQIQQTDENGVAIGDPIDVTADKPVEVLATKTITDFFTFDTVGTYELTVAGAWGSRVINNPAERATTTPQDIFDDLEAGAGDVASFTREGDDLIVTVLSTDVSPTLDVYGAGVTDGGGGSWSVNALTATGTEVTTDMAAQSLVDAIQAEIDGTSTDPEIASVQLPEIFDGLEELVSFDKNFVMTFLSDMDGDLNTSSDTTYFEVTMSARSSAYFSLKTLSSSVKTSFGGQSDFTAANLVNFLNNEQMIFDSDIEISLKDNKITVSAKSPGPQVVGLIVTEDSNGAVLDINESDGEGLGGYFTDAGTNGSNVPGKLEGIISSVSHENGIITLTAADAVKQQFTVSSATVSDPAKPEITEVTFSASDDDYFTAGIDESGTAGRVSVTVDGLTYVVTMEDTMEATLAKLEYAITNGQTGPLTFAETAPMDPVGANLYASKLTFDFEQDLVNQPIKLTKLGEIRVYDADTMSAVEDLTTTHTVWNASTLVGQTFDSVAEFETALNGTKSLAGTYDWDLQVTLENGNLDIDFVNPSQEPPTSNFNFFTLQTAGAPSIEFDVTEGNGIHPDGTTVAALTSAEVTRDGETFTFTGVADNDPLTISSTQSADAVRQVTEISFGAGFDDDSFISSIGRDVSVTIAGQEFLIDGATRLELLQDLETQLKEAIASDTGGEGISAVLQPDGITVDENALSLTLTARYGGTDPLSVSDLTRDGFDPNSEGNVAQEIQVGFTNTYLNDLAATPATVRVELGQVTAEYVVQAGDTVADIMTNIATALEVAPLVASATVVNERFIDVVASAPGPNLLGTVASGAENTVSLYEVDADTLVEVTAGFFADETLAGQITLDDTNPETVGSSTSTTAGADFILSDTTGVTVDTTQDAKDATDETIDVINPGTGAEDDPYFFGVAAQENGVHITDFQPRHYVYVEENHPDNGFVDTNFNFAVQNVDGTTHVEFDTKNYGVHKLVGDFSSVTDFSDPAQILSAVDNDGKLNVSWYGDQFILVLEDTSTGNSYIYEVIENNADNDGTTVQADNSEGQDSIVLKATIVATSLSDGDITPFIGVKQTYMNPDNGYTAIDGSSQFDDGDAGTGDASLFGSEPGYYDDDGLLTSYLNGETPSDTDVDGEGTNRYISDGQGDLTAVIEIDDTVSTGASSTTSDLSGEDVVNDRTGFVGFDWDEASTTVLTLGNDGADVIYNFQTGEGADVIAFEGAIAASAATGTLSGGLSGMAETYQSTAVFNTFDWADMTRPAYGTFKELALRLDISDATSPLSVDGNFRTKLIFGFTEGNNAKNGGIEYDFSTTEDETFANIQEFVSALQATGVKTSVDPSYEAVRDELFETPWVWEVDEDGDLLISFPETINAEMPQNWVYGFNDANSALQFGFSMTTETTVGVAFDLSFDEYFVVESGESSVLVEELGNADGIIAAVERFADLTASDNGSLNTTIFAVTASDDDSLTAIWAHQQSLSDDSTIEASELYHLATVNTVGSEFSLDNFAGVEEILHAQVV